MRTRCFAFRRTIALGAVWLLAMIGFGVLSPAASGQEAFNPGTGNATARLVRVDPRLGGLSFGITNGLALAGHQNTVAQADSRAVDLGVIGTTLAGEACDGGDPTLAREDQPQPVVARSDGSTASSGSSEEIPGVKQEAQALDTPMAEAVTTLAPFGIDGVLEIGSGVARSTSGVVAEGVREAKAVVEYGKIDLAGGAASIRGLRWEAVHRSGGQELAEGTFTIDALSLAGVPIPVSDAAAALGQLNDALRVLGFEVIAPQVRIVEGVVFVDPMRVAIVPAALRDDILGPILGGVQPVREQLFAELIAFDCGNATYVTVADIALGSVTAAGELGIELGGAQATSAEIDFFEFPQGGLTPAPPASPLTPPSASGNTGSLGPSTSPTVPAPTTTTDDATDDEIEQAIPVVDSVAGERGGAMAAVSGLGLLLIAALAEADRRKMRRAQREIPMEMA